MKKTVLISALLVLLLLPSCGKAEESAEPITLFPPVSATTEDQTEPVPQTIKSSSLPTVNKTYGDTLSSIETVKVIDTAEIYRTEDSYKFEQKAVDAAEKRLFETLQNVSDIKVIDSNLWNCVDDRENVYYSVHITVEYKVQSGGKIQSGEFFDIGIRKADENDFDASDVIDSVVDGFDSFKDRDDTVLPLPENPMEQAKKIAKEHLKHPDTASEIAVHLYDGEDVGNGTVRYDAFCESENDFGMRIPCYYSVYFVK